MNHIVFVKPNCCCGAPEDIVHDSNNTAAGDGRTFEAVGNSIVQKGAIGDGEGGTEGRSSRMNGTTADTAGVVDKNGIRHG